MVSVMVETCRQAHWIAEFDAENLALQAGGIVAMEKPDQVPAREMGGKTHESQEEPVCGLGLEAEQEWSEYLFVHVLTAE